MATNTSASSIFNPEVPKEQIPYYLNLPKGIKEGTAYSAAAVGLKGAADLYGSTVNVAHKLTEQTIDDQVRNSVEFERDQYNSRLAVADAAIRGAAKPPGQTEVKAEASALPGQPAPNIIDSVSSGTSASTPPVDLTKLTENLSVFDNARGSGKISKTDYDARLDMLAKDFRAKYPGWRDYIDHKIKSITGEDPANALIRSRIQDINSFIAKAQKDEDRVLNHAATLAYNHGYVDIEQAVALYKAGRIPLAELSVRVSRAMAHKAEEERTASTLKVQEGNLKLAQLVVHDSIKANFNRTFTSYMSTFLTAHKLDQDPQKAIEFIKTLPVDKQNQIMESLQMFKSAAMAQAERELQQQRFDNGKSYADYADREHVNKIMNGMTVQFDSMATALNDPKSGMLSHNARVIKLFSEQIEREMIVGTPDVGIPLVGAEAVQKRIGPNAMVNVSPFLFGGSTQLGLQRYITGKLHEAAAGTPGPDGKPRSAAADTQDILTTIDKMSLTPEQKKIEKINAIKAVFKHADIITMEGVNAEQKAISAKYIFSPGLAGLVARIEKDKLGPDGKPGKYSFYKHLFSPEMTQAIRGLGDTGLWETYKERARSAWTSSLLEPELARMDSNLSNLKHLELTWDSVQHKFGYRDSGIPAEMVGYGSAAAMDRAFKTSVDLLNQTLGRYVGLLKAEGATPEAINTFMHRTLMGVKGQNATSPTADQMISAVVSTSEANKKAKAEAEKAKKAREDKYKADK